MFQFEVAIFIAFYLLLLLFSPPRIISATKTLTNLKSGHEKIRCLKSKLKMLPLASPKTLFKQVARKCYTNEFPSSGSWNVESDALDSCLPFWYLPMMQSGKLENGLGTLRGFIFPS